MNFHLKFLSFYESFFDTFNMKLDYPEHNVLLVSQFYSVLYSEVHFTIYCSDLHRNVCMELEHGISK